MTTVAVLLGSMMVILVGCKLFTNSVVWMGKRLNMGDGSVGSVLAAVGTAMPEVVVPIIAIAFGTGRDVQDIGIGAIIGSSFQLATLAFFFAGLAVAGFALTGRRTVLVRADPAVLSRDLRFFMLTYSATIGAAMLAWRQLQILLAVSLLVAYGVYVYVCIVSDDGSDYQLGRLYLHRGPTDPSTPVILFQMVFSVTVIVLGAKVFVGAIEEASQALAVPALVFAMLVAPFATELPEKFNSILWIRDGKDTLAIGNITGAMVFQSCILPAIGILLTPWQLTTPLLVAAGIGLTSTAAAYVQLQVRKDLHYRHLIGMGLLYLGFAAYALTAGVA